MTPEEACEKHASGVPILSIAREAGVSWSTVKRWVTPGYREAEREKQRGRPSRARREASVLAEELTQVRVDLAATKRKLAASRNLAAKLRKQVDAGRQPPMRLTELHEWWLATKSPEDIVRIAQGLSGWDEIDGRGEEAA